jgi:GNAT superfamily N-acetyltransferase
MIRKAKPEDASRIADIQIFGWRNAYRTIVDDKILFSKLNIEKKAQNIRKTIEDNSEEWLVFEKDEIVKGMMVMGPSRDEDKKDSFELWCIYVDPLMMRQGIGKAMLQYCEQEARTRGYKENALWVLERNEIGKSFYEKNGYKADGKRQELANLHAYEIRYCKRL